MKDNSWIQNIENIFTKEELDGFVMGGKVDRIKKGKIFHYIKAGCKNDFKLNFKVK